MRNKEEVLRATEEMLNVVKKQAEKAEVISNEHKIEVYMTALLHAQFMTLNTLFAHMEELREFIEKNNVN